MGMRISVPFIVQTPIRTHSFCGLLFHKITYGCYLFFSAQFFRQGYFNFSPKPCVFCFFNLVNCVPQSSPICIFSRGIFAKGNFRKHYSPFSGVVGSQSCFFVGELFARPISSSSNSTLSFSSAANLHTAMIDCQCCTLLSERKREVQRGKLWR